MGNVCIDSRLRISKLRMEKGHCAPWSDPPVGTSSWSRNAQVTKKAQETLRAVDLPSAMFQNRAVTWTSPEW